MSGAEKFIHAFMASRLDYCCTLLGGFPACLIYKLQLVQNPAARVLTRTRKDDHISPVLLTHFFVIYVLKFWPVDNKTYNIKIDCRWCIFFLLNTQIQSVSRWDGRVDLHLLMTTTALNFSWDHDKTIPRERSPVKTLIHTTAIGTDPEYSKYQSTIWLVMQLGIKPNHVDLFDQRITGPPIEPLKYNRVLSKSNWAWELELRTAGVNHVTH